MGSQMCSQDCNCNEKRERNQDRKNIQDKNEYPISLRNHPEAFDDMRKLYPLIGRR